MFEIHPATEMDDRDVRATFRPIDGYEAKDAYAAFMGKYEDIRREMKVTKTKTTLYTAGAGFNHVEFVMELREDPTFETANGDGLIVRADVQDLDDELLIRNRRMVFAKGTEPYSVVQTLKRGERLHVLGIPRLNLAIISWRIRNRQTRPEVLRWNLPYEIIVVGAYETREPLEK